MNNLTTLMRSMTVLLFFVMVGASTALAQNRYAERNGIGATPCEITAPCDLAAALGAATSATDTVFVRVRESGAMTRIDEDISTGARTIGIYVEDEDDVTMGMIAVEGDATLTDAITILDGTTLYLEGDVTLNSSTAALVTGDLQIGGSGDLMLYAWDYLSHWEASRLRNSASTTMSRWKAPVGLQRITRSRFRIPCMSRTAILTWEA